MFFSYMFNCSDVIPNDSEKSATLLHFNLHSPLCSVCKISPRSLFEMTFVAGWNKSYQNEKDTDTGFRCRVHIICG